MGSRASRRTFLHICLAAFAGLAATSGVARAQSPTTAPAGDRVTVLISIDGLAGFYFDDPKAEMPNLRALAKAGVMSSKMRTSTPSVTWPTHTSVVTGAPPAVHGVTGNNYLDRQTLKPVTLIGDPTFDKAEIVKVPTIYDAAHAVGIRTAAVRWPACRSAATLDWNVPDMSNNVALTHYSTPSLVADLQAADAWLPPLKADDDATKANSMSDTLSTKMFLQILKRHRPGFSMLHLIDADHEQHLFGPRSPEAYAAIAHVDALVGEIAAHLKEAAPGRATLVVVSDHGFSPIERLIFPNVILRDAGLVKVQGLRVVDGDVRLVVQGGATLVYVVDAARREEVVAKVKAAFADVAEVETIVTPDRFADFGVADPAKDSNAPDLVLFAKEGAAFGDTAAGALAFRDKPERKGTHGHSPDLPNLNAMFIASGAGVPATGVDVGPIRNIDVAPTLARLMNLPLPTATGKVIEAAIAPAK